MLLSNTDYYILILAALALSFIARALVQRKFETYRQVPAPMTGAQAARQLLDEAGLCDVPIECVSGRLSDHYDPQSRVLRLSPEVMNGANVSAVGIAAHEVGHALQQKDAYAPLELRNASVRTVGIGSSAAWPLFLLGLVLNFQPLLWAGVALYAAMALFALITLPVEWNASRRALNLLSDRLYFSGEEMDGARKVLSAAALTYVATALMAVLQFVRFFNAANRRRR